MHEMVFNYDAHTTYVTHITQHGRCTCTGALGIIPYSAPNTPRMRYFGQIWKNIGSSRINCRILCMFTRHTWFINLFLFQRWLVVFVTAHTLTLAVCVFGANGKCPRQIWVSCSAARLYRFIDISQTRVSWTLTLANVRFSCSWFYNRKADLGENKDFWILQKKK